MGNRLSFISFTGGLGLDATALSQTKTDDVYFQSSLGKIAFSNLNQTLFIVKSIEPLLSFV